MTIQRASVTLLVLALLVLLSGCDSKSRGESQTPGSDDRDDKTEAAGESPGESSAQPPEESDLAKYTSDLDGEGALHAIIQTSLGEIRCRLYPERAPVTVANFVGLARGEKAWKNPETGELETDKPFYDGVIFHRVIPNFMIQSGDRTGTGTGGPGYTLPDEFDPSLRHDEPGVLSMANKGEPDSGGSQFFILETPAPHLDERHSIFGKCEDMDIVRKIARVPTGPDNRPKKPPVIEDITFERAEIEEADNTASGDQTEAEDE